MRPADSPARGLLRARDGGSITRSRSHETEDSLLQAICEVGAIVQAGPHGVFDLALGLLDLRLGLLHLRGEALGEVLTPAVELAAALAQFALHAGAGFADLALEAGTGGAAAALEFTQLRLGLGGGGVAREHVAHARQNLFASHERSADGDQDDAFRVVANEIHGAARGGCAGGTLSAAGAPTGGFGASGTRAGGGAGAPGSGSGAARPRGFGGPGGAFGALGFHRFGD